MNDLAAAAPQADTGFDITSYELADSAVLTVKTASGDADLPGADKTKPVQVEIFSPGSPEGLKASRRSARQQQLRMMRALRGESPDDDVIKAETETQQKLVGYTKRLINFPIDPEKLYANPRLIYIAKQVEDFIAKYGNFSKGSSAS